MNVLKPSTAIVTAAATLMAMPSVDDVAVLKDQEADRYYKRTYGSRKSRKAANPVPAGYKDNRKKKNKAAKQARKKNRGA